MNYHLNIELALCCDTPLQLIGKVNTQLKKLNLHASWNGDREQCFAIIQFDNLGLWKEILNTVAKAKTKCGCCCLNGDAGCMGLIYLDTHISNDTARYRNELIQNKKYIGSYLYNERQYIEYKDGDWCFKEEGIKI